MLHIISKAATEVAQNLPALEITQSDGGVVQLRCLNQGFDDKVFEIDPNQHFKVWGGANIYFGDFVYADDIHENREKDAFIRTQYVCAGAVATLGWGATKDDVAIVSFIPVKSELEVHVEEPTVRSIVCIDKHLPNFAKNRLRYVNARRRALEATSPIDAIADLEKQVDLLSILVFKLIETSSGLIPNWYEDFKTVVEANSSSAFKTFAATIDDIELTKSQIRQIQVRYFMEKNS